MMNPEDHLWGIGEKKWFQQQVKTFGLAKARKYLQDRIDEKAQLKRNNPKEYHRIYKGMG